MCNAFDARILTSVEARIRKEVVLTDQPSKLIVDYGCDGARTPDRDVFLEDGSGHGGTLRIVRFHRESDRIVVRAIESSHYYGKGIEIRSGDLDAHALDKILPTSRVALVARPHVVRLQGPAGVGLGISGFSSSNDFHLRLSIVDDGGRVTDGAFTGYDGSDAQAQIVPMRIATEPLQTLVGAASLAPVPATDADREMVTERFLITMDGEPYWWVEERYVALVAQLGTIDAVPALVAIVGLVTAKKTSGSGSRVREAAIDAIAAITGWNPRLGPRGTTRTTPEAALAIAAECAL